MEGSRKQVVAFVRSPHRNPLPKAGGLSHRPQQLRRHVVSGCRTDRFYWNDGRTRTRLRTARAGCTSRVRRARASADGASPGTDVFLGTLPWTPAIPASISYQRYPGGFHGCAVDPESAAGWCGGGMGPVRAEHCPLPPMCLVRRGPTRISGCSAGPAVRKTQTQRQATTVTRELSMPGSGYRTVRRERGIRLVTRLKHRVECFEQEQCGLGRIAVG